MCSLYCSFIQRSKCGDRAFNKPPTWTGCLEALMYAYATSGAQTLFPVILIAGVCNIGNTISTFVGLTPNAGWPSTASSTVLFSSLASVLTVDCQGLCTAASRPVYIYTLAVAPYDRDIRISTCAVQTGGISPDTLLYALKVDPGKHSFSCNVRVSNSCHNSYVDKVIERHAQVSTLHGLPDHVC
jgi:hypothetical protein